MPFEIAERERIAGHAGRRHAARYVREDEHHLSGIRKLNRPYRLR